MFPHTCFPILTQYKMLYICTNNEENFSKANRVNNISTSKSSCCFFGFMLFSVAAHLSSFPGCTWRDLEIIVLKLRLVSSHLIQCLVSFQFIASQLCDIWPMWKKMHYMWADSIINALNPMRRHQRDKEGQRRINKCLTTTYKKFIYSTHRIEIY